MEYKLSCENSIFKFSGKNEPILRVPDGSSVIIETKDCFSNQLRKPTDTLEALKWDAVNPATGPIYIENAAPGDVLKVTIEEILLDDQGVMFVGNSDGVLHKYIESSSIKIIPIQNNNAVFNGIEIPVNPMIGVIGVAPSTEDISTGTPGSHGGNMDNNMIGKGAVVYFPILVPGALFALGDLHAIMGDGEICGTGVEISGTVKLKLEVIKNMKLKNPLLENSQYISTIASAQSIDDAVNCATIEMALMLSGGTTLTMNDIAMLMSITGNAEICQVVDPLRTARFTMPRSILEKFNFKIR